jgi:hypothetical protein
MSSRWSIAELDARWVALAPSPRDLGRVVQVCVRPDLDQRAFPGAVELCPRRGAVGDRWERRTWVHLPDGRPDPRVQVAMMEARTLRWLQDLTGCAHHPGDTLIVDFDLGVENLPAGTHLRVGAAVVEIADIENDACAKFAQHYGMDVLAWIRAPANRAKRLRGLFARVVAGGGVREGDAITREM